MSIDGAAKPVLGVQMSVVTASSGDRFADIAMILEHSEAAWISVDAYLPDKGVGTYMCRSLAPLSHLPEPLYTVFDPVGKTVQNWEAAENDPSCTISLTHYDRNGYAEGEAHGDVFFTNAGVLEKKHVDVKFRIDLSPIKDLW
jgi:hypothetical protein